MLLVIDPFFDYTGYQLHQIFVHTVNETDYIKRILVTLITLLISTPPMVFITIIFARATEDFMGNLWSNNRFHDWN